MYSYFTYPYYIRAIIMSPPPFMYNNNQYSIFSSHSISFATFNQYYATIHIFDLVN